MSSGNLALTQDVATLTVDSSGPYTYTKPVAQPGTLYNSGPNTAYISYTSTNPATTDAQAIGVIGIPSGASFKLKKSQTAFSMNCKSAQTAVVYWQPEE